jgi:hypothetical protein
MKHVWLLILLVGFGCQSPPAVSKRQPTQAAKDLTAKLKNMSPQERSEYLKNHPEELRAATGF